MALILHLLRLTEFQLIGCAGCSREEATQSRLLGVLNKPLSLSTFSVIQSDLDAASMEILCRSCKKLTVFHYDEGDMGSEQLSHRELNSSLQSQRHNLVNLRVGHSSEKTLGRLYPNLTRYKIGGE